MKRAEKRWVLLYAAFLGLFTTLPYLVASSIGRDAWEFTGFLFGVEDGNSYIAKMLMGSSGQWLFRTPYTAAPQSGVLAFIPYILLGKLAGGMELHQQLVALFHLFRLAATPLAVFGTYQFIGCYVKRIVVRRWATILATLGGGLGWLLLIAPILGMQAPIPVEWYSPEWFGFLGFFGLPHLVLARGLMLLCLASYLRSVVQSGPRVWSAGLYLLGLGLVHPLGMLITIGLIGVHQGCIWIRVWMGGHKFHLQRWLMAALHACLPSLPLLIYFVFQFTTDPFLKEWTGQNRILSPPAWNLLAAYGLLLLPAIYGVRRLLANRPQSGLLPIGWIVISPFLAYAPHNLQRRLIDGVFVAWVILAAYGIQELDGRRRLSNRKAWIGLLLCSLPSTMLLWAGSFLSIQRPDTPHFRPRGEIKAMHWLQDQAQSNAVVLGAYETGNVLPAWANVRVVIGHGPESVDLATLNPMVTSFYLNAMTHDDARIFLKDQGVSYIFVGPQEEMAGEWMPDPADLFELRYQEGAYRIYEVMGDS